MTRSDALTCRDGTIRGNGHAEIWQAEIRQAEVGQAGRSGGPSWQISGGRFPTGHASGHRSSAGFTMIEILIVIAIISVLIVGAVLGFHSIQENGRVKQTKVALESAEGMLRELDTAHALSRLEWDGGPSVQAPPPVPPFTIGEAIANPGQMTRSDESVVGSPYEKLAFDLTATKNCQAVMRVLTSIPKIKSMVQNLPKSVVVMHPSADASKPPPMPVLLDGWGNPLLYVPSGGLQGVNFSNGANNQLLTSTGKPTDKDTNRSNRAFWASAGPDGNFATGDDNVYSFDRH